VEHEAGRGDYRDGLSALLADHLARRARVLERARALPDFALRDLLPAQADELRAARAALGAQPKDRGELDDAEEALARFEGQLDLALGVIADVEARRASEPRRLRRALAVLGSCWAASDEYENGQCSLRGVDCAVADDADCKPSRACREDGRCYAITHDGETVCSAEER
jgi:hypothetical protein